MSGDQDTLTVAEAATLIGVDATSIQGKRSLPGSFKARVPVVDKRGRTFYVNRTLVPLSSALAEIERRRVKAENRQAARDVRRMERKAERQVERELRRIERRPKRTRPERKPTHTLAPISERKTPAPAPIPSGYVSAHEAAEIIGLSPSTVSEYARTGRLAGSVRRPMHSGWIIRRDAAEALRAEREKRTAEEAARKQRGQVIGAREVAEVVYGLDLSASALPENSQESFAVARVFRGQFPDTREACEAFAISSEGEAARKALRERIAA